MFDIDYFKSINDEYGHQYGDQILKQVADIIKKNSRDTDIIARYGGEEFISFLFGANKMDSCQTAERICTAISNFDWGDIKLTISAGVSSYSFMHEDISTEELFHYKIELIKQADQALYNAKRNGRNQVYCYKQQC
jgi:diguanylate cyclase (GGDEF)-like protein